MSTTTQQPGDPAPAQPTATPAPAPAALKPTPTEPKAGDQPKAEDEALGEGGKKALVAEREARETAEKALAALQREIEDSKKTAEQKAADDLEAARKEAAENATKALRYEVAAEKGLDLALASRLTGATREELEADADVLKGLIPTSEPPAAPGAQPVPTIGKTPPSPTGNVSLGDQIAAAEAAGDKALVGRLKAMQLGQSA